MASSNSQDVMDRLQKRDLSIYKTPKSSTSETIDLDADEPIVNIKEETSTEITKVEESETQFSAPETPFSVENDNTQSEYDHSEYDESYAGKSIYIP